MAGGVSRRTSLRQTVNLPEPIPVRIAETKEPAAVFLNQTWRPVTVRDRWLIEDGWWREPLRRMYFEVLTEDGILLTVFWDLEARQWFRQRY